MAVYEDQTADFSEEVQNAIDESFNIVEVFE